MGKRDGNKVEEEGGGGGGGGVQRGKNSPGVKSCRI